MELNSMMASTARDEEGVDRLLGEVVAEGGDVAWLTRRVMGNCVIFGAEATERICRKWVDGGVDGRDEWWLLGDAVSMAARAGDVDTSLVLLSHGGDADGMFEEACMAGMQGVAEVALGAGVSEDGLFAGLAGALMMERKEMAEMAVRRGTGAGQDPDFLLSKAALSGSTDMLAFVESLGVDVGRHGARAAEKAAGMGNMDCLSWLADKGVKMGEALERGVEMSVRMNKPEILSRLIGMGAARPSGNTEDWLRRLCGGRDGSLNEAMRMLMAWGEAIDMDDAARRGEDCGGIGKRARI